MEKRMKRIILSGANGAMGHEIAACVSRRDDCKIVAGLDINTNAYGDFPIFAGTQELKCGGDVIIDFSHVSVLTPLLAYAVKERIPVVLCTTGYTQAQVDELKQAAKQIPVFYSRNMSLGINLLIELAKKAAVILGQQFDIEIIEKHHNQKIDAPSGTALMIADGICQALEHPMRYEYDRHSQRKKRDKNEIGLHAVRGGTIVGEHEVLFAGHHETLSITHTAQSKEVFATGSVNAAIFLTGNPAGLYDMADLIDS